MSIYDALAKYPTRAAAGAALIVFLASLLRLIAIPLALGALVTGRAVLTLDAMATPPPPRHQPPQPPSPRWAAANTRTGATATIV